MRLIVRYTGVTLAVLGAMGLTQRQFLGVWVCALVIGLILVFVANAITDQKPPPPRTGLGITSPAKPPPEAVTQLHVLAIVFIWPGIIWGILNLIRKRRPALVLIVSPIVLVVVLKVLISVWLRQPILGGG